MAKLDNNGVPHSLSTEEAINQIKDALNKHNSKVTILNQVWKGEKCDLAINVNGSTYSGTLTVERSIVRISGNFPPMIESMLKKVLSQ